LTLLGLFVSKYILLIVDGILSLKFKKIKTKLFRLAAYIPQVQAYLDDEKNKMTKDVSAKYSSIRKGKALLKLPE